MRWFRFAFPWLLFALNISVSWRLFSTEYTSHYDSIEPFFYALAAYIKSNWLNTGWWREWNCGMPFHYTYQPLLHYTAAAVSAITDWSAARAFHATLALFYSAGPVTLYLLASRFSGSFRIAASAALLYSLWSPSTWLVHDILVDTGGAFHCFLHFGRHLPGGFEFILDTGGALNARRLHTAVVYGDGPYISGLTLVPLALWFVHRAVMLSSIPRLFLSALGMIAVPLTNIPAALSLGMMLLAYLIATEGAQIRKRVAVIAGSCVGGYLLVVPLMPVSGLLLTARNTQWMDTEAKMTLPKAAMIGAGLLVLLVLNQGLRRLSASFYLRFTVFFC